MGLNSNDYLLLVLEYSLGSQYLQLVRKQGVLFRVVNLNSDLARYLNSKLLSAEHIFSVIVLIHKDLTFLRAIKHDSSLDSQFGIFSIFNTSLGNQLS